VTNTPAAPAAGSPDTGITTVNGTAGCTPPRLNAIPSPTPDANSAATPPGRAPATTADNTVPGGATPAGPSTCTPATSNDTPFAPTTAVATPAARGAPATTRPPNHHPPTTAITATTTTIANASTRRRIHASSDHPLHHHGDEIRFTAAGTDEGSGRGRRKGTLDQLPAAGRAAAGRVTPGEWWPGAGRRAGQSAHRMRTAARLRTEKWLAWLGSGGGAGCALACSWCGRGGGTGVRAMGTASWVGSCRCGSRTGCG
jgi:hypothetical protein